MTAILLFLLFGFGIPAGLGLLVSFPVTLPAVPAASELSWAVALVLRVGSDGVAGFFAGGAGNLSFRPVEDRTNSPGFPVMGFSSINSLPYWSWIMRDSRIMDSGIAASPGDADAAAEEEDGFWTIAFSTVLLLVVLLSPCLEVGPFSDWATGATYVRPLAGDQV